jgi:hypothetical protein
MKIRKFPRRVLQVAYESACRALPAYRHKFSPRKFTQPQLMACLVLKEFLRTDYRGLAAHLADRADLCRQIGLKVVPHFTTFQKAAQRLLAAVPGRRMFDAVLERALRDRMRKRRVRLAAIDGTGMESRHVSRYFTKRLAVRSEQSVPALNRLEIYLRDQHETALPKSQYGQAIVYALNHWDELRRFTEDGRLEIDNNTVERTLRICAISRKNWLFVGSDQGGETAAICFSILAGAKRHRIEPLAYVSGLLMALSSNEVDLESLLPDVWIPAHPERFLKYRRDEAEAAAIARRRRRERRRAKVPEQSRSP